MTDRQASLFNATMSTMYHRRRLSWLENMSRAISFGTLACGTAGFASLFGENTVVASGAAVLTALASIVTIVYQPETAAAAHRRWHADWKILEAEIKSALKPTPKDFARWNLKKAALETEYTAELRALQYDCFNRVQAMNGDAGDIYQLRWYHRRFIQVASFENACPDAAARRAAAMAPEVA